MGVVGTIQVYAFYQQYNHSQADIDKLFIVKFGSLMFFGTIGNG